MRIIPINRDAFCIKKSKKQFILLGAEEISNTAVIKHLIEPKIEKKIYHQVPGFWGTLGHADDSPVDWEGYLEISAYGNDSSSGMIKEEIKLLYKANPYLDNRIEKVTERFISFENVKFNFPKEINEKNIPELRLTLMLSRDEGALVFYHHQNFKDSTDEALEYILPAPTPNYDTRQRDRLTYIFPIIPQTKIVVDKNGQIVLSDTKVMERFIIRVLTYKRGEFASSNDVINKSLAKLKVYEQCIRIFDHPELLKYNPSSNQFDTVNGETISSGKKTLLLIHGTFASTEKSFHALYKDNSTQWLKSMLKEYNGKYEQILAFDHPTIIYDAETNIKEFFKLLGESFVFSEPVDIIASSQGGLLAQYLANLPLNESKMNVGRVALIASANGVDYFTSGKHVAKFLTVLKYLLASNDKPLAALICELAQHSAEFFLSLPGCQLMTPGNPKLESIVNGKPSGQTVYLPIIDNFDEGLRKKYPIIKKWTARGLDLIARSIMGQYNDWVVRTENQYKVPKDFCYIKDYDPKKFTHFMIPSIHGEVLSVEESRNRVRIFLMSESPISIV